MAGKEQLLMGKYVVESYGFQQEFHARSLRHLREVITRPRVSRQDPIPINPDTIGPDDVVFAPDGYIYSLEDVLFPRGTPRPISYTALIVHLPSRGQPGEEGGAWMEKLLPPPEKN